MSDKENSEEISIEENDTKIEVEENEDNKTDDLNWSEVFFNPKMKKEEMTVNEVIGYEGKTTMIDNFEHAISMYKDKKCYAYRDCIKQHIETSKKTNKTLVTYEHSEMKYLTYEQVCDKVKSLASGVKKWCPDLEKGSKFGIYLHTCKEWIMMAFANAYNSIANVTCYSNLGEEGFVRIIKQCELSVVIASAEQIEFIDTKVAPLCSTLKKVVVVGNSSYKAENIEIMNFNELVEFGKKNMQKEFDVPTKDDLAFIMYTSGTTGAPKGVMMSHKNVVAAVAGGTRQLVLKEDDVHLSYLPMSHIFELVFHICFVLKGRLVGFGTPRTLLAKKGGALRLGDLVAVRPTLFIGVPRVFLAIKAGVEAKVRKKGGLERCLFNSVLKTKLKNIKKGKNKSAFLENLVFKAVRVLMGGRIRYVVSGGAPFSPETQQFLQAVLGVKATVLQGYGLTETMALTTGQDFYKYPARVNSVGIPVACTKIRLRDVPEMNYFVKDGKGEICIGGDIITLGYYKMEEKTKKDYIVKDGERWFITGDVGAVTKDGRFSIIDRIKNLVKLSGGEYVALEAVETHYENSQFVAPNGICIVAKSKYSFIVAVCLLDVSYVKDWAKMNGIKGSLSDIMKNDKEKIKNAMRKDFEKIHALKKLASFEKLRNFEIYIDEWTPESDLVTASMKKKRKNIQKKYESVIDELYSIGKDGKGGEKKKSEEAKV